jgi:putative endopeptidase
MSMHPSLRSAIAPALLAAVSLSPAGAARAQSAAQQAQPFSLERTVDEHIRPGDDFFAYANGAWLAATTIPSGKPRWGARDEIAATSRARVAKLIDDARSAPPRSLARKVADFSAAYANDAAIETRGITPLRGILDSIERVADKAALARLLGSELRADVDPLGLGIYRSANLLGLSVELGIHGEMTNRAFLLQGGLGLGDRAQYLSADTKTDALRTRYQDYIGRMLALAGFNHADARARSVMALETAVAQTQATADSMANDHNADHVYSLAGLARMAPGMDWSAYFAAAALAKQDTFVAWQPGALTGLASLVSSQPLDSWKDYLRFHTLDLYADVLPRAFAEQALAIHSQTGRLNATPRAQRASDATLSAMGDAIGQLYADRFFPAEQKARVQRVVGNVVEAFANRVASNQWLSAASKAEALAKLKLLYVGIGYPDRRESFADLTIDPNDAMGNARRVSDRTYRLAVARVGRPIDRKRWWMPPHTPSAVLVFQQNAYDFTAALMQPPKFDPAASDAAVYGSIGAIIGHDVSHYIDVLGANYDTTGAMHHWWTPEDSVRYLAATAPLVEQFSAYHPFPDASVNGELTRTENVADLAGLDAAFLAFRKSLGGHASNRAYVKRQDRDFFIAFAQSFRTKIGEPAMRAQLASNDHAPEPFRMNTVRNIDAWYDAFDVQPGDKLYVEPKARVRVW